jgi:hypothetical protein
MAGSLRHKAACLALLTTATVATGCTGSPKGRMFEHRHATLSENRAGGSGSHRCNACTPAFGRSGIRSMSLPSSLVGTALSRDSSRRLAQRTVGTPSMALCVFDGDRRGYMRCTVEPSQMRADFRTVPTVSRPDAPESTYASFVMEDGRPGAVQL